MTTTQRTARSHMKLRSASQTLKRKLEQSYAVNVSSSDDAEEEELKKKKLADLTLYESMMRDLKDKFNEPTTSYAQKLQILTLSPFSKRRTIDEFGATNHMITRSRKLRAYCGILGMPDKRKGKKLSEEIKVQISEFYQQDDVRRVCPGKKDYKSIKTADGSRSQQQKRLLLGNLKELYQKWKNENSLTKVGFSTFAALRPQWCILAGAHGTHSVCVCTHHQNPKLMVAALSTNIKYLDLIEKTVCSIENEQCMMGRCKKCPGKENVIAFLNSLEECQTLEEIEYKQWESTDKTTLNTLKAPISDFVENLADKITTLSRHHYISKAQNAYLKKLKEIVRPEKECILLGDFAENYSFIVQDAAQGFHWENSQATLHPFVAYHRSADENPKLIHTSMCVISDSGKHSTATVHAFQKRVVAHLQTCLPSLRKIHYFSDGCAGQYKNRYNFINLCNHQYDFNLDCEWNFFATSHGKSACDGIGGTVKRLTAKASLQRPVSGQILTPKEMYDYCKEFIPGQNNFITVFI
jgi:hypothetical protein